MRQGTPAFLTFAAAIALSAPLLAEKVKVETVIVSHSGGNFTTRSRNGPLTVVVGPHTSIKEVSGLSKKERDLKSLIPGLIIKVEGEQAGGSLHASKVEFKKNDWRAAIASKAGTQEQFADLRKAIIEGHEYVIRHEATVYFATGSSAVAASYQQALRELAQKAPSFGNYRISILGYADPRGDAAANERLSLKRAAAVSNLLRQTGHIQPGRVLSPTAMGEGAVAPDDAVPKNNDEARRVVVRVVTPKTQLAH
jgi:outer membrane protein OmpA-like peptidoglycan-associated protein